MPTETAGLVAYGLVAFPCYWTGSSATIAAYVVLGSDRVHRVGLASSATSATGWVASRR